MRVKRNRNGVQQHMFRTEDNLVPIEEYREMAAAGQKRTAHERKFMNTIIETAHALDLPCVHVEYFCGNKFYPTCTGKGKYKHAPVRAVCPKCGREVLAICVNRINKGLAGHFDIIGIGWAIETKHKVNKGPQEAKLDKTQVPKAVLYDLTNIPHITINEDNEQEVFNFLREIHNQKFATGEEKEELQRSLQEMEAVGKRYEEKEEKKEKDSIRCPKCGHEFHLKD